MRYRISLTLLLLAIPLTFIFGQKFRYVLYEAENVPFKKVNQTIEDSRGYMWIATDQGLFRFDGTSFEDFNTSLESRYIKSMVMTEDESILFTNDTGVHSITYLEETIEIKPWLEADDTDENLSYPGNLFYDNQNRLWVGQLDGSIFLYANGRNKPTKHTLITGVKTSRIFFGEDKYQTIWILVPGQGLFYFKEESNKFVEFGNFKNAEHFLINEDRCYLAGKGLLEISFGPKHKMRKIVTLADSDSEFHYITKDNEDLLFLSSENRLFTLLPGSKAKPRQIFGSNDPHRVENLPVTDINHIFFSSDQLRIGGMIWVSTSDGLGLLYSSFFKAVTGMSLGNVLTLGTTDQNEVLVSQGNVFQVYDVNGDDRFEELKNLTRVTGITSHKRNNWYATREGKIHQFRGDELVKTYDVSDRGGGIFYMYADHKGEVWFCQAPTDKPIVGMVKISRDGQLKEYGELKGLKSRVLVIDEGGRQELYAAGIGIDNYLYKYNRATDNFENRSVNLPFKVSSNFEVHDLAVDSRGMVWMGTTDGLLKFDTEHVQRVQLGDYTEIEVRSVVAMPDGSVWLATDTSGMIHLDADGDFVNFNESSGTPSKIASYRAMAVDKANRLWIGTAEGAVYSVLEQPGPLSTKTPLLKKVMVNARDYDSRGRYHFSRNDIIDFYFTSIAYPGQENKYQYKIYYRNLPEDEIEDIPWTKAAQDSKIRISPEDSGHFGLMVQGQKPGGYAWSAPTILEFNIKKIWYASWWGILLLISTGLFVFLMSIRYFSKIKTRQLQSLLFRKEKELGEKEKLLSTQTDAIKHQEETIKSAGVNNYLLFRLLRQIPKKAKWTQVIPLLSKLVELPTGIDAFELGHKSRTVIKYLGYKRGVKGLQHREVEFNEKENLTSFALSQKKSLIIKDHDQESNRYINLKDNRAHLSRIYVPFEQIKGSPAILCAYGKEKNMFTRQDMIIIEILATFLSANVTDELK
jgi:AraC family chitin signaling transcriptional activator